MNTGFLGEGNLVELKSSICDQVDQNWTVFLGYEMINLAYETFLEEGTGPRPLKFLSTII